MDVVGRKIIHVDMDAYYASVEQRDAPELRGRPVAVGGTSRRGVVMTASYEARRFGVHSAMPSAHAVRLCPEIVVVPPRFDVYREVSRQIRAIFHSFSDLVEPLSLDEAYIDVTIPLRGPPSATLIAQQIKDEILTTTGLTSTAGVSYCKFLAKTASGMNKPNGLTVILPEQAAAFLAALPIEEFHGIGPATAARMRKYGINCGADLTARDEAELVAIFGKSGRYFRKIALGLDDREVRTHHERKSIGGEETFERDLILETDILVELRRVARKVGDRMERAAAAGRTVTLKIKYHDFAISTRSRTLHLGVRNGDELLAVGADLLRTPELPKRPIRLIGLSVSNLYSERDGTDLSQQLGFGFDAAEEPVTGEESSDAR